MNIKGYAGLSAFSLLVLLASVYVIGLYNSHPASALELCDDGNSCFNPPWSGYDYQSNCGGCATGYTCQSMGACCDSPPGSGGLVVTMYDCVAIICPNGKHLENGVCIDDSVCGNGICESSGSPVETTSNCPQDCDPCAGVTCNSPPADYCDQQTDGIRHYYSSPGTCSAGTCTYTQTSSWCNGYQSTCADTKTLRSSMCGSVCGTRDTNCGADYYQCSGTIRQLVSPFCTATGGTTAACSSSTSNVIDCATRSGWVDTSSCAWTCSGLTPVQQKTQEYRSYTCSSTTKDCAYTVTNSQVVTCATGSACPSFTCTGSTLKTGGSCSAGSCVAPATTTNCQPAAPICVNSNTQRSYTAGCAAGSCNPTASFTDTACTYGCNSGTGTCNNLQDCSSLNGWYNNGGTYACCASTTQPATCQNQDYRTYAPAVTCSVSTGYTITNTQVATSSVTTCSSSPDSFCANANTITAYSTPGTCSAGTCSYTSSNQPCTYGCLSLPGPDTCAANTPPALTGITVTGSFSNFARNGQTVTVTSTGSDANGETIRLECGSSSGTSDLCVSGYFASGPSCTFANPWVDSSDHTVYCRLRDSANAVSNVQTAALAADNTVPTVSVVASPSNSVTPGTTVTISATGGDARSGLASLSIMVDNAVVATCGSTTCNYNFNAAYGAHTYNATSTDNVGLKATSASQTLVANRAPNVLGPIYYTGECKSGSMISLHCNATDADQSTSLNTRVWAGQCTAGNCFNTRSWAGGGGTTYFNNAPMVGNGEYVMNIVINQPTLTGIAATCTAIDELGAANSPQSQGDNYNPLCIVDRCITPPAFTMNSIGPNPARTGAIRLNFTITGQTLSATPVATIKFGSQIGGTIMRNGTLVSHVGADYVYDITVQPSDLNGIADIYIIAAYDESGFSCPVNRVTQVIVDTQPPTTTMLCGGASCGGVLNNVVPSVSLVCSDATTGCKPSGTLFATGSSAEQTYTTPFSFPLTTGLNTYTVRYHSEDNAGNTELDKSTPISVYGSPCVIPAEEPNCASGRIQEEIVTKLDLNKTSAIAGSTFDAYVYCISRNKLTKSYVRDCVVTSVSAIIDKGQAGQKDYFNYCRNGICSTTSSSYSAGDVANYISSSQQAVTQKLNFGGIVYNVMKRLSMPIDTNVFHSDICVNVTDQSGQTSESCSRYNVTNSELTASFTFPDAGNTVPFTTDGYGAPNFTKLMPINFMATPQIITAFTTGPCTSDACKVEFSFDMPLYDHVAQWDAFTNSYTPQTVDVASNGFDCNAYKTLYVRATKQLPPDSGIYSTSSREFFVNCNVGISLKPPEVRYSVGQTAGKVFELSIWNPTNNPIVLDIQATSNNEAGYPLQWISMNCNGNPNCATITATQAQISVPAQSSSSIDIDMPTAPKSGTYPVTFIADDQLGNRYSAVGNILIFSEGLDEFQAWQLIVLVGLAAYVMFSIAA